MNSSDKLSTQNKLLVGFGVIIIAIIIMVTISYRSITRINGLHQDMIHLEHTTIQFHHLGYDEVTIRALSFELLFEKDVRSKDSLINKIQLKTSEIESDLAELENSLVRFPDQNLMLREIAKTLRKNISNQMAFTAFVKQGKIEEAHNYIDTTLIPIYKNNESTILNLENDLDKISSKFSEDYASLIATINYTLLLLGLSVILISCFIAVTTFVMLKRISKEIKTGVAVLGTSAAEILSTVTEISTGAAETATAVSETTTTVEEVRQTAMVSYQKSQSLISSSQKAADSVEKGRVSINEVIVSMKNIDNQMSLISETVIMLADQNRAIGEITSSVADIADQSNLLAVNAAIEAAKAGEHGRGFTVVAQEIRSLADQSKKATAQVKEILSEINKSVNQTVGVTEQGTKTVEEGRKLVTLSGEVIEVLAENVEEAAQASIQISSSNQQQMAGMEQIVPAMENIKIASQQNVSGIKQAQAAAHDLNSLGQNLQKIIEKYKL